MADIWLFPWLFPPAVLRRLWQMLAVPLACYLVPFPPGRCQIFGCFLAVGVPFVGRLWLFLGCCRALFALALFGRLLGSLAVAVGCADLAYLFKIGHSLGYFGGTGCSEGLYFYRQWLLPVRLSPVKEYIIIIK